MEQQCLVFGRAVRAFQRVSPGTAVPYRGIHFRAPQQSFVVLMDVLLGRIPPDVGAGNHIQMSVQVKIGSLHDSRTVGYPGCEIWTGNSENSLRTVRFTIVSWIGSKSGSFDEVELANSGGANFESLVLRAETIFFTKFFFKHYLHDEPCPTS